jgi:hypothetical protein
MKFHDLICSFDDFKNFLKHRGSSDLLQQEAMLRTEGCKRVTALLAQDH